jgi:molybdopterin molybdotransferase
MISVAEASGRIVSALSPVEHESADIAHCCGRVPAEPAVARTSQPPFAISTITGFAVRACDGGTVRNLIGTVLAGRPYAGRLMEGDAVKIFSGAVVPEGADAIVRQEEALVRGDTVSFAPETMSRGHIRPAGSDFSAGNVLAPVGKRLTARDCALLAAGDLTRLSVRRRPRLAIASIGSELSRPGIERKHGLIAASTGYGLSAMIQSWGGAPCDFGILPDTGEEIATVADADADLIVTLGGVTVGDRDAVRAALGTGDFEIEFWNVALLPERPLIFGRLGKTPLIGLPGHPVAAMIYAQLFLKPAVAALLGADDFCDRAGVKLVTPLPANGGMERHLPASIERRGGDVWAEAMAISEQPTLTDFAAAGALIVRLPNAGPANAGDRAEAIMLDGI